MLSNFPINMNCICVHMAESLQSALDALHIGVNFLQIVGGGAHGPFLPLPFPLLPSPPLSPLPSLPLSLKIGPRKSS